MFRARWPAATKAGRSRWIAALAILSAVVAGILVYLPTPDRSAEPPKSNCQKFKDMMDYSSNTATSIDARFNGDAAPPGENDFREWAFTMQKDAAQITGGPGELGQVAQVLARDSGEIDGLFLFAENDPAPDVVEEEGNPDWIKEYNAISRDFNIALDEFRVDCPGMTLG